MDGLVGILFGLLFIAVPIALIVGVVFLILKFKSGTNLKFSFRSALRIYFHIAILVSVGFLVFGGVSALLNVGFGEVFGKEFSYGHVYEEHYWDVERLNNEAEDGRSLPGPAGDSLDEKIDRAMKTTLINGVSLTIIGAILLLVHLFGRRWVQAEDPKADWIRRWYLFGGLVVFSIFAIGSLIAAVPETLRYVVLGSHDGEDSPGEALALGITSLPVWITYLIITVKSLRSSTD